MTKPLPMSRTDVTVTTHATDLSAATASHTAPDATMLENEPNDLGGLAILLVEDHEVTRRATAELLGRAGARVMQVPDGRSALHALAHSQPDILLLDLMLPDMDGGEVLRALQNDRPASLRCVFALTGDVTPARRDATVHSSPMAAEFSSLPPWETTCPQLSGKRITRSK